MRAAVPVLLLLMANGGAAAIAAVSGTVVNGSTGKPLPGAEVALIQATAKGMEPAGTAKTGASGEFSFDKDAPAGTPILLQVTHQGVLYTKTVSGDQPRTGVTLDVFDMTSKRDGVAVDRHGILIEPSEDKLSIREFVFVNNTGKATYQDASVGAYRFWAPDAATKMEVSLTTQGGMPVRRSAAKAGPANTWKIDYPLRPGQTQVEISYELPKSETFSGNVLHKEGETRLIVPKGLTLKGEGLEEFQPEPRTQALIYGVKSGPFSVTIAGKAVPPEPVSEDSGSPEVGPGRPRIYSKMPWILGLTAAILLVGLYSLAKSK